ncbi:hypothetical protein AMELA_G00060320, partial [Ameiurus melas]
CSGCQCVHLDSPAPYTLRDNPHALFFFRVNEVEARKADGGKMKIKLLFALSLQLAYSIKRDKNLSRKVHWMSC